MLRGLGVALLSLSVMACQPEGKSSSGAKSGEVAGGEIDSVGGIDSPSSENKGPGSIRAWECQKFWDDSDNGKVGPVVQPNPDWTPDKLACGPALPEGLMVLEREDGTVRVEELLGGYIRAVYDCQQVPTLTYGPFLTYQCFDKQGRAVGTIELDQTQFIAFAAEGDAEGIQHPISDGYIWPGAELPQAGVETEGLRLRCAIDVITKHYDQQIVERPEFCDPAAEEAARKLQEQAPSEPEPSQGPTPVFI